MDKYPNITGKILKDLLDQFEYNSASFAKLTRVTEHTIKKYLNKKQVDKYLDTNTQLPYWVCLKIFHIAIKNKKINRKFTHEIYKSFTQKKLVDFRSICKPNLSIAQFSKILILEEHPFDINLMKKWDFDSKKFDYHFPIHFKYFFSLFKALKFDRNFKKARLSDASIAILTQKITKKNKNYTDLKQIQKNPNNYKFDVPEKFPEIFKIFANKSEYTLIGNMDLGFSEQAFGKPQLNKSAISAAATAAAATFPATIAAGTVFNLTSALVGSLTKSKKYSNEERKKIISKFLDESSEKIKIKNQKVLKKQHIDIIINHLEALKKNLY